MKASEADALYARRRCIYVACCCVKVLICIYTYYCYLGAVHSHDPSFTVVCGIRGCTRTYHNFHSFRKHLRRSHLEVVVEKAPPENELQSIESHDLDFPPESNTESPSGFEQKNSALFLLKAREVHKVSQSALNELTTEFTHMSSSELEALRRKVFASLEAAGITPEEVGGLSKAFKDSRLGNPYSGLSTEFQQRQYYKHNLNLVVSLCRIHVRIFENLVHCQHMKTRI